MDTQRQKAVTAVLQLAQAAMNNLLDLEMRRLFQVGDMTCFVFADPCRDSQRPEWGLHVLRGWRFEYQGKVLTGIYDYFEHRDPAILTDDQWDPSQGNSRLDHVLRELLSNRKNPDELVRDIVNHSSGFVVSAVSISPNGDCTVQFENRYTLHIIPLAGTGEAWALFQRGNGESGFSLYMQDLAT